jgi:sugar phosphate isomerase/epimerase
MIVRRRPSRTAVQRSLDALAEVAGRGLARAGVRRMALYERRLDHRPVTAGEHGELAHDWLGPPEVARLATVRGQDSIKLLARLDHGARCFGTTERGRVVATRWVATGAVEVPFLRVGLRLAPDDAWVWDSWTDQTRRGARIAAAASAELGETLARDGVRRLVAGVMVGNRPGRSAVLASGYAPLGTLATVRLWSRRHVAFRRAGSQA